MSNKNKFTYINARGETVDLDLNDGDVIPSGFGIRTSTFLMDGVQREIAASDVRRVTDGFGAPAGHRPGFVYDARDNEAAARIAYDQRSARMQDAWRNPSQRAAVTDMRPVTADDIEAERERYKQRLSNAWRTSSGTGFGPGSFGAGG